jgi:hypothetical protein
MFAVDAQDLSFDGMADLLLPALQVGRRRGHHTGRSVVIHRVHKTDEADADSQRYR